MAQKSSRFATLKIGDATYQVVFSILAIVALRDHWGLESDDQVLLKLDKMGRDLSTTSGQAKIDFRAVGDLLWAGLRRHHPDVTPDQCLSMLDDAGLEGLPNIMSTILSTLSAAAPPEGARQARPPKRVNGKSVSTN